MITPIRLILLAATFCGASIAQSGVALAQEKQPSASDHEQSTPAINIELEKGEVLQIITPQSREGGRDARQAYYDQVFPIAAPFGFQRLAQINVRQKVIADYDPGAFIFFSWPSQAAVDEFESKEEFPAIVAARPAGWDELRIYMLELQEALKLRFDPEKHYTVVVAWTHEETAADYEKYLQGIEPAVAREGGRFIYKMRYPRMEAHNSPADAPSQLTFVEWADTEAFSRVQQSEEYLAHRQYFASGVKRFEFFWLKVPD